MPHVTLDLVSLDGKPLSAMSRRFEGSGGTIGREESNTLALPDAQRRVSRLHAAISFPGGVPTITNSSSVLPIGADGVELQSGQTAALVPGMTLNIGPYVLVVRPLEEPEAPAPPMIPAHQQQLVTPDGAVNPIHHPLAAAPVAAAGDPFADLLSGLPGPSVASDMDRQAPSQREDDPLAALIGSSAPAGARSQMPRAHALPVHSPPSANVIPEDFNPFDLPSAAARNSADPLSSMLGESAGSPGPAPEESIDALCVPSGAPVGGDILDGKILPAALLGDASDAPFSLLAQPQTSDPLALFGGSGSGQDSFASPMRDDLAEVGGAYEPPRAIDPAFSLSAPAQSAPPTASRESPQPPLASQPAPLPAALASYPADELTRAFLTGASLPPDALPHGLTPEVMGIVGGLLRSATAGAIEMLAVRASIKREVQASVTIISSEANNPLKFLPDAESVLLQLLGKRMRGFMSADEAMKDAFGDLRAHESGVIAGTRAALDEVLRKFDPTILGDRLIKGSLLEKALPAMRKTKLWDLYVERYGQMRREVEDDFQSIFGKAFLAAYEAETARMKTQAFSRGS